MKSFDVAQLHEQHLLRSHFATALILLVALTPPPPSGSFYHCPKFYLKKKPPLGTEKTTLIPPTLTCFGNAFNGQVLQPSMSVYKYNHIMRCFCFVLVFFNCIGFIFFNSFVKNMCSALHRLHILIQFTCLLNFFLVYTSYKSV